MEFLANNWEWLLLTAFMIAEKAIRKSKSKKDDIVLDIFWEGLKLLAKKGREVK